MEDRSNLVTAIERFDAWQTPWEFLSVVSADPLLTDADRRLLDDIWVAACARDIWLVAENLVDGTVAAEVALGADFPGLSALAR